MFENEKKSPLERLKKGLYSRNDKFGEARRHEIHEPNASVPEGWNDSNDALVHKHMKTLRQTYSFAFLIALVFFVIAGLIAGDTLFWGRNFVSVNNVDILVEGPVSIGGGEELPLNIMVQNKNSTRIENVNLIVEFPAGTKDPLDPAKDLTKTKYEIGSIDSQAYAMESVKALVFGEEGAKREIKFSVEYGTVDSNAIFQKKKSYFTSISSSPILVSIQALDKVLGGQQNDVVVTISSNSTLPLKNLLLLMDYPFGFTVNSATPAATYGDNIWRIGDLAPGAKRTIRLRATTEGQNEEDRTIRANVGIQSEENEREIATNIISRDHVFKIEKPFLGLDLALDGQRKDLSAVPGRLIRAEVIWTNNSANRITDGRIEAKLSGNALDRSSVEVDDGYYDSSTDTIIWEAGRTPGLDTIAPGSDGRVSFSFESLASTPGQSIANPIINVSVSAKGDRVDVTGASSEISTAVTRSVKLVSNLALSSRGFYSQGGIDNSGPIPPKVDQETTYTIVWTVTNTSNNITGAKVTATLPPNVSWKGVTIPTDANITYNPTGGVVTWLAGTIPKNADIGSGAKQVAFQISLKPSANQLGKVPELVSTADITGLDSFTGATIKTSAGAVTTRISGDLTYKSGDDIVKE
jgi:hypothetical protein